MATTNDRQANPEPSRRAFLFQLLGDEPDVDYGRAKSLWAKRSGGEDLGHSTFNAYRNQFRARRAGDAVPVAGADGDGEARGGPEGDAAGASRRIDDALDLAEATIDEVAYDLRALAAETGFAVPEILKALRCVRRLITRAALVNVEAAREDDR